MTAAQKKGEKITLAVERRDVFGKKLGPLRETGKVPANVFGNGFESTAVSADVKEFLKTLHQAGETQVVHVMLDKKDIPALIANVHYHPVTDDVLHADFRKIDLSKKTEAQVPVVITGEPKAVAEKKGDLLTLVDSLTVEALPDKIPSEIEVDVSALAEIDDAIKISDLKKASDYEVKDEADTIIAKIAEHKEEDLEPAAPVEGEEVEGEEAPEGEAPAEGDDEAPAEGGDEKPAEGGDEAKEE